MLLNTRHVCNDLVLHSLERALLHCKIIDCAITPGTRPVAYETHVGEKSVALKMLDTMPADEKHTMRL